MTRYYYPFDSGPGASVMTGQWSRMARLWKPDGVIFGYSNEYQVFADSSGKQVKVKTGAVWIKGGYAYDTAENTIALASNASGNPRIDVIAAEIDWVNNTMGIVAITGTPGVTPSAPALTQTDGTKWQIKLAQVAIANGYTTVAAGDVSDYRSYCQRGQINILGLQPPVTSAGDYGLDKAGDGGVNWKQWQLAKGEYEESSNLYKMPDRYSGGGFRAKFLVQAVPYSLDNCDTAWTANANVTQAQETSLMKEGAAAQKFTIGAAFTTGIAGYHAITSVDLHLYKKIYEWIKSDIATNAGDLQLVLDNTAGCVSPEKTFDVPALAAGVMTLCEWDCGDMSATGAIISVGLKVAVDKGAQVVTIDQVCLTGQSIFGLEAVAINPGDDLNSVVFGTPEYSELTTLRFMKPVEIEISTPVVASGSPAPGSYLKFRLSRKNDASDTHGADVAIITSTVYYPEAV